MKKFDNKVWMVVAVIFAIGAIVFGVLYANNKQDKLISEINSQKKVASTINKDSSSEEENLKQDRGQIIYSPMGDSLTAGFSATKEGDRFTNLYAKALEDNLGYKVQMADGASKYGGLSSEGVDALEDVKQQQPNLVTIEYGTNDSDPKNNSSLEEYKTNITQIINELQSMEKPPKLVLVTTWNQGDKAVPFDNFLKEIGEEKNIPVADISSIWKDSSSTGPKGRETFLGTADNFHPNDDGMSRIANTIYNVSYEELIK